MTRIGVTQRREWDERVKRVGVALALVIAGSQGVVAGEPEVEEFVASLNSEERKQELRIERVEQAEETTNRLEVVFEPDVPVDERGQTMQKMGEEFLRLLFFRQGIPSVVVVERDHFGNLVQSITTSVTGDPLINPLDVPQSDTPC